MSLPDQCALNIVTPNRVATLNCGTLSDIYTSKTQSIIAAKETKDDSGLLAIADSRLVLIHDIRESLVRRRHTVSESSGKVQLLAFGQGSHELFFTTGLQNAVRCYEVRRNALRKPVCVLPRPPVVLAVSWKGEWLVTACENPSQIFVLTARSQESPNIIDVPPSSSGLAIATFSQSRTDMFLLGFCDGLLAVYSAKQVYRGRLALAESSTRKDEDTNRLVAADFLGGGPLALLSVLENRLCQIFTFHKAVAHLSRRWRTPSRPTCLSVLPRIDEDTNCSIAIGMKNGEVVIYNEDGALLRQVIVDLEGLSVVDVDWASFSQDLYTGKLEYGNEELEASIDGVSRKSNATVVVHGVGAEVSNILSSTTPEPGKRRCQKPLGKYTWKPPAISTPSTHTCKHARPTISSSAANTRATAADGTNDAASLPSQNSASSQPSVAQHPPKLFERFRSLKSTTSQEVTQPAQIPFPNSQTTQPSTSGIPTTPALSTTKDNDRRASTTRERLQDRQKIAQQRKLTPPPDSTFKRPSERTPFTRPNSRLSSVDEAEVNQAFANFSSRGTICNRSEDTGPPPSLPVQHLQLEELRRDLSALREDVSLLTQRVDKLQHLLPKSPTDPQAAHRNKDKEDKRCDNCGCCAARLLSDLLRLLPCNSYATSAPKSDPKCCNSSTRLPAMAAVQPTHDSAACEVHSPNAEENRAGRGRRVTSNGSAASARAPYRHRRTSSSLTKPGWIRIGKFQVRRMSRVRSPVERQRGKRFCASRRRRATRQSS